MTAFLEKNKNVCELKVKGKERKKKNPSAILGKFRLNRKVINTKELKL
jgi:hypothetical protein